MFPMSASSGAASPPPSSRESERDKKFRLDSQVLDEVQHQDNSKRLSTKEWLIAVQRARRKHDHRLPRRQSTQAQSKHL